MKNSEQPAFPVSKLNPVSKDGYGHVAEYETKVSGGLNKREYFAAMAMQGIISSPVNYLIDGKQAKELEEITALSIQFADEILKQLES